MKPLLTLPFLLLATPALAFEHAQTGFAVDLSDEFIVDADIEQMPDYDILVGINPVSGDPAPADINPHVCQAGFQGSDGNAGLKQKQINAMADTRREWGQAVIGAFEETMIIQAYDNFSQDGIVGIEVQTEPRMGPDAENTRIVFFIMETPRGRTMLVCTATKYGVFPAMPVFERIREGITAPR